MSVDKLEFDLHTHSYMGEEYKIAIDRMADDPYTKSMREHAKEHSFITYIISRAKNSNHPFKVIDVGANIGAVSLPLAAHKIAVLSIEAVPQNYLALLISAETNGFTHMTPLNVAVYSSSGLVSMSSATVTASIRGGGSGIKIACHTLSGIMKIYNYLDCDIIKIDIEGAEMAAFQTLEEVIAQRHDLEIVYESNTYMSVHMGHDQQALAKFLEERGLYLYAFWGQALLQLHAGHAMPAHTLDILATRRSPEELVKQNMRVLQMTDKVLFETMLRQVKTGHHWSTNHARLQEAYLTEGQKASAEWAEIKAALPEQTT